MSSADEVVSSVVADVSGLWASGPMAKWQGTISSVESRRRAWVG